ncbi:MAG: M1 family metallopeptidase [Solitalea sp.]
MRKILLPVLTAAVLVSCAARKLPEKHVLLPGITITENISEDTAGITAHDRYQGSYTRKTDLLHTDLDLSFNWDSSFVHGQASLKLKPYFYTSDSLILDAKGFRLHEVALVTGGGRSPLDYSYDGQRIRIGLDRAYTRKETYQVFIRYTAMPDRLEAGGSEAITGEKGLYFIDPRDRDPEKPSQIWTQGETEANSAWFPTIDGPQENHTQRIALTVDEKYVTLSNGRLVSEKANGDGTRTDVWEQELPHATYLTMIAVGDFAVVKDRWRDLEVNYYVEPEYESYASLVFGNTPEMMEFYSELLGVDYPWSKYAQIVVRDFVSGAMENTTASVFFDRMNMTDREYLDENHEDIIAHELFHHWFGNLVTCESWSNLPLNEAFATYGEYLWLEYKYGRAEADVHGFNDLAYYLFDEDSHDKDLIRFEVPHREDMFDVVTYQKGGRVLHMLRKYVGDEAFFEALRQYLENHRFQTVEIHDLRMAFEAVTGEDLNWFFNQWMLDKGHPELNFKISWNAEAGQVVIRTEQTQDLSKWPLYKLPLAVDFYLDGKVERKQLVIDQQVQTFTLDMPREPELVNMDAEKMLLARVREDKPLEQWVFQYYHAPLYMDKYRALQHLVGTAADPRVQEVMLDALDNETTWAIRLGAIHLVSRFSPEYKEKARPVLVRLATEDEKSLVRALAVEALAEHFGGKQNKTLFEKAAKDPSPAVEAAAKKALKKR